MPKIIVSILILISCFTLSAFSQVGITVSPGRVYYHLPKGGSATQKVVVNNPNNRELEVGVSLSDWEYDSLGNNVSYSSGTLKTSCAKWIQVMPGSYFTLGPQQQQTLDLLMTVPQDADTSVSVHTAMLYVTQLNASSSASANGASINVTVRMGIKLYHAFGLLNNRDLDITDFKDKTVPQKGSQTPEVRCLDLLFTNTGKTWIEGNIRWELLNRQTGEKNKLEPQDFYSLPGDKRIVRKMLPEKLKKGKYNATAIVNYGSRDELKVAELEFDY